jgi:hypothetical protein
MVSKDTAEGSEEYLCAACYALKPSHSLVSSGDALI